jgi:hypothetical protein
VKCEVKELLLLWSSAAVVKGEEGEVGVEDWSKMVLVGFGFGLG